MRNKGKKIRRAFVFRAVFALEAGGGRVDVEAKDKNQAIEKLRKTVPFFDHKVKTVEVLGEAY